MPLVEPVTSAVLPLNILISAISAHSVVLGTISLSACLPGVSLTQPRLLACPGLCGRPLSFRLLPHE
jgi:hypothetical protein